MKKTCVQKAYAKINYYLSVGARRTDGFHDIETLMQTVSLADEVEVTISDGEGISLEVIGNPAVPCDNTNLVWRAAELYLASINVSYHVEICLKKQIPMAGGLAGGSADAAAVLRALNHLHDDALTAEQLCILAGKLGSDIPFCILGGLAMCTGRGEIIEPLQRPHETRHFLIVNRGEHVNTGEAYAMIDASQNDLTAKKDAKRCIDALYAGQTAIADAMYNHFEDVVLPMCPLAKEAKKCLLQNGAYAAMMSGSGSTVYGIFTSREKALAAQAMLPFESVYATDVFERGNP